LRTVRGMRGIIPAIAAAVLALGAPGAALAETQAAPELAPYLQCVPYARQLTGIQIYGDARTWWQQAEGRYERGSTPRVGAVMAFVPHRNMTLGHVAAVSRVIDSRTVLLDHANWSPIGGQRGQIERDVRAIDVSHANDWSEVKVWYGPIEGIGTTAWPVHGFIYGGKARLAQPQLAAAPAPKPISPTPSRAFSDAFAGFDQAVPQRRVATTQARPAPKQAPRRDPIDAALARYGS
jgi:surface antigen